MGQPFLVLGVATDLGHSRQKGTGSQRSQGCTGRGREGQSAAGGREVSGQILLMAGLQKG